MKISAVVLTKDEEENIKRCLDSLGFCDEILIIDDYSSDQTVEIAKNRRAVVFKRKLNNNFSAQRNFGLKKASNKWVLFVDADETVSPALSSEIVRRLKKSHGKQTTGFYFYRKDFFLGHSLNYGETSRVKLLRLAKKTAGRWEGKVHEEWKVKGRSEIMKNSLFHYSHEKLTDSLEKINFYTDIRAQELADKGEGISLGQIILYPLGKFLKNYFWHQGFRDGTAGIIFALMMSFHSFLVRAKLWQLKKRKNSRGARALFFLIVVWVFYIFFRYLWLLGHWR